MTFSSKFLHYSIVWKRSAEKDLETVPSYRAKNIQEKIEKIIKGDPTLDIKKLQGYFNTPTYRLRVGEPNYIKDAKGKTIQVLLDMKSYDSMMNRIREFESIIKAGKSARKTKKPKV